MSNGIYLTLEQYKDKDLPITITINGHTYHSQQALELAADNTYSDKEMARMHNAWYDEGYEAGIDHGIEQTLATAQTTWFELGKQHGLQDDRVKEEIERTREQAYKEGYDAGKKANGYTEDDIKQLHTDNEFTRKIWYDKGKAEGYAEGKADGFAEGKEAGFEEGFMDLKLILKKD